MVKALKQLIRRLPFYHHLKNKWRGLFIDREIKEWERKGRRGPPPHKVKQETILAYAQERKIATLVESGTFQGDMVEATKRSFSTIYSIELSPTLCDAAKRRFRNDKNVKIVQGDSGAEMKKIVAQLSGPAIFWLDGHYSGGETALGEKPTPVYEELAAILSDSANGHVILIDDARCFRENSDYGTIEQLMRYLNSFGGSYRVSVENDCIRIVPAI